MGHEHSGPTPRGLEGSAATNTLVIGKSQKIALLFLILAMIAMSLYASK